MVGMLLLTNSDKLTNSLAKQSVTCRKLGLTHSRAKGFEFPSYMNDMRLMFGLVKPLQWHLQTEVLHTHKGNNDLALPCPCPYTQFKKSFSKMFLSYCWTEDHSYAQDTQPVSGSEIIFHFPVLTCYKEARHTDL